MHERDDYGASRATLEALIAQLPESALLVLDRELRIAVAAGDALRAIGCESGQMVGRTLAQALGSELADAYEPHVREALSGSTFTFTDERMGRQFVARGAPLRNGAGPAGAALVLLHDVTASRSAEQAHQALRDRQAFLFVLTERLRALEDPAEIEYAAVTALRERLGATRVGYGEDVGDGESVRIVCQHTDGAHPIEGEFRYDDFGAEMAQAVRAGRTLVRCDVAATPSLTAAAQAAHDSLGVGASVIVPLVKGERPVALLFVHQRETRSWSEDEIGLMQAVADQTWAAVERARAQDALRLERVRAQLALEAAAMGSFVWWAQEDRTESDERMLALFGLGPEDELSLQVALAQLIHPDDRARYAAAVGRALDPGGDGVLQEEIRVRRRDGRERWLRIDGRATFAGRPRRAVTIAGAAADITERKWADMRQRADRASERLDHQRTELLSDVIAELETLDTVQARLERLVTLLVPRAADYGWIELPGNRGEPRRLARQGWPARPGEPTRELALPLSVRGRRLATLILGFGDGRDALFSPGFLGEFIARIEVNLDLGSVREEEHGIALGLQRALLPNHIVEHPGIDIAARYEAGSDELEVGGDWYDAFALPDGLIGLCVGDVVGHGLEAAAAMGRMRVALATLAAHESDPGRVLAQLEEIAAGPNGVGFLTVAYAILDPGTRELRYASAGHPPMLVVSRDGAAQWLDAGTSSPLSGWRGEPRPQARTMLEAGSLLVLYSDGLIERRGESLDQGLARLAAAAERLAAVPVREACDELIAALGVNERRADDVAVVCVRPH